MTCAEISSHKVLYGAFCVCGDGISTTAYPLSFFARHSRAAAKDRRLMRLRVVANLCCFFPTTTATNPRSTAGAPGRAHTRKNCPLLRIPVRTTVSISAPVFCILYRELFPLFSASCGKHTGASYATHSLKKSVHALSPSFFWSIC